MARTRPRGICLSVFDHHHRRCNKSLKLSSVLRGRFFCINSRGTAPIIRQNVAMLSVSQAGKGPGLERKSCSPHRALLHLETRTLVVNVMYVGLPPPPFTLTNGLEISHRMTNGYLRHLLSGTAWVPIRHSHCFRPVVSRLANRRSLTAFSLACVGSKAKCTMQSSWMLPPPVYSFSFAFYHSISRRSGSR